MDMLKRTRLYDHHDDRISCLPDCLILEILSALPTTNDAIRTCCLSKRWKSLWSLLPNLILINNKNTRDTESHDYFFSCLDKTMTQLLRSPGLKLNKFQLHSVYVCKFEAQVNKWIRYAISCNAQDLDLSLCGGYPIVLDELLFNNSIFTHLKLACSFVNPTGTFSWINLKSLYISETDLNDDSLQNLLSGSPRLETFTLHNCYGFENLDFTSSSVKKLVISGDTKCGHAFFNLTAPNISSLKLYGSVIIDELFVDVVSPLAEAHLDYPEDDDGRLFNTELENDVVGGCILMFRHVKELKLGLMCSQKSATLLQPNKPFLHNIWHTLRFYPVWKLRVSTLHRTSNALLIMALKAMVFIDDRWHIKFMLDRP